MSKSGFSKIPTEIVEAWTQYLDASDLCTFRLSCVQANKQTFDVMARRLFSTVRTTLLGSDLAKLEAIAGHETLRKHVKTIHVEDDFERSIAHPWNMANPSPAYSQLWPRDESGMVIPSALGVRSLNHMLAAKQLCPETMEIYENRLRRPNGTPGQEVVSTLAKEILDGAGMAVTSIRATLVGGNGVNQATIRFSPEHQGQGLGFSLVRHADLSLAADTISYFCDHVFGNASKLISLSVDLAIVMQVDRMLSAGSSRPKLKRLALSHVPLSADTILAMLSNSSQSLNSLILTGVNLNTRSTWDGILAQIGTECVALNSFALSSLSTKYPVPRQIRFTKLEDGVVVPEQYRAGLKVVARGPADNRRHFGMRYDGPDAGDVLRIVARNLTMA